MLTDLTDFTQLDTFFKLKCFALLAKVYVWFAMYTDLFTLTVKENIRTVTLEVAKEKKTGQSL